MSESNTLGASRALLSFDGITLNQARRADFLPFLAMTVSH
jgi:hypothetical protein